MILTRHDRLFVLTGAGVSAESGLATFRGSGGLWNGYRVDQVATPEAWHADPKLVWRFYSKRRHDALAAQPNAAHVALAKIEQTLGDLYLCTQNVDDLHERGGSLRVHHMHGTLFHRVAWIAACPSPIRNFTRMKQPAHMRTVRRAGSPAHLWFGEIPLDMDGIYRELDRASHLLVVGTSGSVYPAAGFVHIANQRGIRTIYVGPEEPLNADAFDEIALGPATESFRKYCR